MKNIIAALILLLSISSASALEVQCDSPWQDILVVFKKSPASNISYLLFLGETELEKYYIIPDSNYHLNENSFTFSDEHTNITIDFHLAIGGIVSEGALFREQSNIPLHNCRNIIYPESI